ncbi:MAG: tetratricopeptide repeat protein [Vicinamibacterales bacterium]
MARLTREERLAEREHGRQLLARGERLREAGRYVEAERALSGAVQALERGCGPTHLDVAHALNHLGMCNKYLARFIDAGLQYQRALSIVESQVGRDNDLAASLYHNLGGLEHAAGNWLRGEPYARLAVRIRTRLHGRNHPFVASDLTALAALLDRLGHVDEAERHYARALAILEREHGPDHHLVAVALNNLGAVRHARGDRDEAEAMYRRALDIEVRALGPTHPKVGFALNNLAVLLKDRRRYTEAATLFRRALKAFTRELGPTHPNVGVCLENYAAVLSRLGRGAEAASALRRAGRIFAAIDAVNEDGVAATGTVNPLFTGFRLAARRSPIHRIGVFADEDIPKGYKVIEYTGERIPVKESERRWNPKRSYLFELTTKTHLDGAIGGSGAEFINHSCDPNLKTRIVRRHILYYSTRDIKAGEELTVDYRYDHDTDRMPCYCGSSQCRGTMNMLPPKRKSKKKA